MVKENEFSESDTVRVKHGAFASFVGKVVKVDNVSGRLTVEGRFEAEPESELHALNVSCSMVEKIGRPEI